jgi:hypothetical protein
MAQTDIEDISKELAGVRLDATEKISQSTTNNAIPIETPATWGAARKKALSDYVRRSPAWQACETGMSFDVNWYLKESKHPDFLIHGRDSENNSAFIAASSASHVHGACVEIIRDLLKAGADINASNDQGRTALMEASLWGGLGAVEALIDPKWDIPVNLDLRDKDGFKAIDLAGTGKITSIERYKRSQYSQHVEKPYLDSRCRETIVRLLQKGGKTASIPAPYRTSSSRTLQILDFREQQVTTLQAELAQSRSDAEVLQVELETSRKRDRIASTDITRMEKLLEELEQRCKRHEAESQETSENVVMFQTHTPQVEPSSCREFTQSTETLLPLPDQRDNDKQRLWDGRAFNGTEHIKFEQYFFPGDSLTTDVKMIRTFKLDKRQWFENGGPRNEYDKAAFAYMKLEGTSYVAKAGRTPAKDQGFIKSDHWTKEVMHLSKLVGHCLEKTWATHAELQLMALYVTRHLEGRGFQMSNFGDLATYETVDLVKVRIYVSQAPCSSCQSFLESINTRTRKYAYGFVLVMCA